MNEKCQVFTPSDYVQKLLDSVGYRKDLYGKKVLENSCGDGNILVEVVHRYIADCKNKGMSRKIISDGLARDITAFEIDERIHKNCLDNLNDVIKKQKIPNVSWQVFNEDFLLNKSKLTFDYIIGNPPYLTYSDMDKKDQIALNKGYISCKKGKFDYCYAFIEKSLGLLSQTGKMAYLVPSSIFKTVFGFELRKIMLPHITEIQDFTQEQVFDTALVKSAIVVFEADNSKQNILYIDTSINGKESINKMELKEKWVFKSIDEGERRFGDYYKVSHAVATLLNDAFVLKDYKIDKKGNYLCGKYVIEKEIVREAATPKKLRAGKIGKIIFPYTYDDEGIVKYEEDEISRKFPGAYAYLSSFKKRLERRKSDKNARWFEYGRSQALSNLNREKCLISTVVSSDFKVYKISSECIPYAGMYIIPKKSESEYNLDYAIKTLNSEGFLKYVDGIGVHINGNALRITSKDIENYMF